MFGFAAAGAKNCSVMEKVTFNVIKRNEESKGNEV